MRRGEMAMYVAQPTGGIAVYEPGQEEEQHSAERLALIGELRQAIDRGELALDCQPKVDCVTGVVVGAEALVRCKTGARRTRTLVLPRRVEASPRRHATRLSLHTLPRAHFAAVPSCVRVRCKRRTTDVVKRCGCGVLPQSHVRQEGELDGRFDVLDSGNCRASLPTASDPQRRVRGRGARGGSARWVWWRRRRAGSRDRCASRNDRGWWRGGHSSTRRTDQARRHSPLPGDDRSQ